MVKKGKYQEGRFSDELVAASAKMIREWNPQPPPKWVACVPSLRHPDLVPDFARRLAKELGLEFFDVIVPIKERPEQKTMENSIQQARNLDGKLDFAKAKAPQCLADPVLLVDDMADSRWTLAVCAWLLRNNGCGEVWPMILAMTTRSGGG